MVSFSTFSRTGQTPVYTQIVLFIQRGIAAGTIRPGDELPSRRVLSSLLGVNPNTIQKAYRLLEEDGLIQSRSGAKSCISASAEQQEQIRSRLMADDIRQLVRMLRQSGVPKAEALSLISRVWDDDETEQKEASP